MKWLTKRIALIRWVIKSRLCRHSDVILFDTEPYMVCCRKCGRVL
jgi:hypothetical protein